MIDDTASSPLPTGKDPDTLYQETIDAQRAHLMELQTQFNKVCDEAKKVAQDKLKGLAADDKEGRKTALEEQKTTLEGALKKLKADVNESTRKTMKLLEAINTEREKQMLAELDKELAAL